MKLLIIIIFFLPLFAIAQINRSATELAKERVAEYITTKIFRGVNYEPVSYGPLKSMDNDPANYRWMLSHQFEITDTLFVADKKTISKKPYIFSFYLNKKLEIVSADGYHRE